MQARAQSMGEALQAAEDLGQDVARYGLFQKGDLAPRQERAPLCIWKDVKIFIVEMCLGTVYICKN